MEKQQEKVRRLSDEIIGFNPKCVYRDSILNNIVTDMRTTDGETAVSVYKQICMRIRFSAATSLGAWTAGIVTVAYGLESITKGPLDLAGIAYGIGGIALIVAGFDRRSDSVKMRDNLESVIKEARRQKRLESR